MITIKEQLEADLPANVAKRAIKNTPDFKLKESAPKVLNLAALFIWSNSPEGGEYWFAVTKKYISKNSTEKLPKLTKK